MYYYHLFRFHIVNQIHLINRKNLDWHPGVERSIRITKKIKSIKSNKIKNIIEN